MNFTKDFFFLQWDFLEKISNNQLSKLIGIVPLVGYLILFNDEMAEFISFDYIVGRGSDEASPFFVGPLSKLRLVFFGSLLLFISNVLFQIFRPKELRMARDEFTFSELVRENFSVYELQSMEASIHSKNWIPRLETFWVVLGQARQRKPVVSGFRFDVRASMFRDHGPYIYHLSREWWVGCMHSRKPARWFTFCLAILGYLMLAVPSVDIMQAVICDFVETALLFVSMST